MLLDPSVREELSVLANVCMIMDIHTHTSVEGFYSVHVSEVCKLGFGHSV